MASKNCGECGKAIVDGYIDVTFSPAVANAPRLLIRLHSNGGYLAKYRLKCPISRLRLRGGVALMPGTLQTANLPAGALAPAVGVYVVMHREPPHEVLIPVGIILPRCSRCAGTVFSLKRYAPQLIAESEFFR
jgi:hypothetical protein